MGDLPDLLAVFAKWAPIVQTSALTEVLRDLDRSKPNAYALVEKVAARAAYGADSGLSQLQKDARERDYQRRKAAGLVPGA